MISPVDRCFLYQVIKFFNQRLRQAARGSHFILCNAAQECKLFRPTDMNHRCQEDVESVSCPSQILLASRTWYSAKSGPKLTSFASTMRETMMISVMEQKGSTTMTTARLSLMTCYSGWDNYQISLARTVARLTHEQLAWRPTQEHRSVGELVQHIIIEGRIDWIGNVLGEGSAELKAWPTTPAVHEDAVELVKGLETSWQMIEDALTRWSTADL